MQWIIHQLVTERQHTISKSCGSMDIWGGVIDVLFRRVVYGVSGIGILLLMVTIWDLKSISFLCVLCIFLLMYRGVLMMVVYI